MKIPAHLAPHTVGLRRLTGTDAYGKPTHGGTTFYAGSRWIAEDSYVPGPGGATVLQKGKVVFGKGPDAEIDDLVVLPDGTVHQVLKREYGLDGPGNRVYTSVEYG